ncbi:hypothetical protein BKA66DRAFT_444605 [Pyrenochaeta sp. MPI-SDFR-AT-0127]|nr:hypothetical protein BKA66DRAFT_444605 [Pyrenochaeta sp. MPI-SDFR-AT-0127]
MAIQRSSEYSNNTQSSIVATSSISTILCIHQSETESVHSQDELVEYIINESPAPDADDPEWYRVPTKFWKTSKVERETTDWEWEKAVGSTLTAENEEEVEQILGLRARDHAYTQSHRRRMTPVVSTNTFDEPLAQIRTVLFEGSLIKTYERVLYMYGQVGWGKSTLIEHLSNQEVVRSWLVPSQGLDKTIFVATYVFDSHGDSTDTSVQRFIESILHQMLSQFPALIPMAALQLKTSRASTNKPQEAALKSLLKHLAETSCWILLDSLDLYQGDFDNANRFLEDLRSLHDDLHVLATGKSKLSPLFIKDHIILTSQTQAMRLFVEETAKVRIELQGPSTAEQLIEWARGSFLALRIALDSIRDQKDIAIITSFPHPPQGLRTLYRFMLGSIDKENQKEAAKMIRCMISLPHAARFLFVAAQLARDPQTTQRLRDQDLITMNLDASKSNDATEYLRKVLPAVKVVHNGGRNQVFLEHPSIHEFFSSPDGHQILEDHAGTLSPSVFHCECLLAEASFQWNISIFQEIGPLLKELEVAYLFLNEEKILEKLKELLFAQEKGPHEKNEQRSADWNGFLVAYDLKAHIRAHHTDLGPTSLLPHALGIKPSVYNSKLNLELVEILLTLGANVDTVDNESGEKIWHNFVVDAWQSWTRDTVTKEKLILLRTVVQRIVPRGANLAENVRIQGPDSPGKSIMSILSEIFHPKTVSEILPAVEITSPASESFWKYSHDIQQDNLAGASELVWYCSSCKDGPYGFWQVSCQSCYRLRARSYERFE